ncbi:MAG: WapI family immunity protein [Fluviicola sp.]
MQITNEGKTRRIDFVKLESVREQYPSHRIGIEIKTENIQTNFNHSIWWSEADLEQFLIDLELLDSSRKGKAVLESMSPGEMELIFQATDKAGHLSVLFHLVKKDPVNQEYAYDIRIEFQIDPTSLPRVKKELTDFCKYI